ncbi:cytochrome c biogenesis protein CcsA [Sulfobacillus sp. DSM 109850]|uniref:Heme exporter protein C n=2 Tax=Sulfobacillus harzensis TaxID=2729629 RepID=A0A7Y0L6Y6_9FIRM|nr:cytochrome c biogenesis protein CcsA [Sulfobacillus harzensis]NMP23580.1 cytochrome c biogenesis protein CcsA [Sulfobacillus harzensis]
MGVALYLNFVGTPDDRILGASQRIFYVHMGTATTAGLAFTVTAACSILYLVTKNLAFDVVAAASAEIGTVFTTMLLVTGVLWGRAAWGVWWTWDPRLTATVILWVLFLAYLLVRGWTESVEPRARLSAVLALAAYVDVPIDYMTIRWWKSIHPVVITSHGIQMAPVMVLAMFVSMAAMLALYGAWMQLRVRLGRVESGLDVLKQRLRSRMEE